MTRSARAMPATSSTPRSNGPSRLSTARVSQTRAGNGVAGVRAPRPGSLRSMAAHEHPLSLSVVVPVYNEEGVLDSLRERVSAALADLPGGYEVVLVDDGSHDRSVAM